MQNILLKCFFVFVGLLLPILSQAGKLAWTSDQVSTGLYENNSPVIVSFKPSVPIPDGAQITNVFVSKSLNTNAVVQTKICLNTVDGLCKNMRGKQINTGMFNGKSANSQIVLVHDLKQLLGNYPPIFIRTTVTVWYKLPNKIK